MDHEETKNAIARAYSVAHSPDGWSSVEKEVDYAIVKLGDTYLVCRSYTLGSLDYEVICNCENHHEAREIVRALNK